MALNDRRNGRSKNPSGQRGEGSRVGIIQAIKVPLNFFVLCVLVTEAILGMLAPSVESTLKAWIIAVMLGLVVTLVFIVAYMAVRYPNELLGRPMPSIQAKAIEKGLAVIVKAPSRKKIVMPNGVVRWSKAMDQFVGHSAVVRAMNKAMRTAKLDIDQEKYDWSLEWLDIK